MQLQGKTTICLVRSGLKIDKTGPETAKISPTTAKIAQKCTFLGQIWLSEAETVSENGTGELFAFSESNNDICIISGPKIEKSGPETGPQLNQLVTEQKK